MTREQREKSNKKKKVKMPSRGEQATTHPPSKIQIASIVYCKDCNVTHGKMNSNALDAIGCQGRRELKDALGRRSAGKLGHVG